MNFRGWALYILFNMVQDSIAARFSSSEGMGGYDEQCHYGRIVGIAICSIRASRMILPVTDADSTFRITSFCSLVTSCPLFCLRCYFAFCCRSGPCQRLIKTDGGRRLNSSDSAPATSKSPSTIHRHRLHLPTGAIPVLLLASFMYLNFLVFLAVHRTAAYFHTSTEIAVGYAISLLVQIPLGVLLWGTQCLGHWDRARALVGLPPY